jgi:hypothetical protein
MAHARDIPIMDMLQKGPISRSPTPPVGGTVVILTLVLAAHHEREREGGVFLDLANPHIKLAWQITFDRHPCGSALIVIINMRCLSRVSILQNILLGLLG